MSTLARPRYIIQTVTWIGPDDIHATMTVAEIAVNAMEAGRPIWLMWNDGTIGIEADGAPGHALSKVFLALMREEYGKGVCESHFVQTREEENQVRTPKPVGLG